MSCQLASVVEIGESRRHYSFFRVKKSISVNTARATIITIRKNFTSGHILIEATQLQGKSPRYREMPGGSVVGIEMYLLSRKILRSDCEDYLKFCGSGGSQHSGCTVVLTDVRYDEIGRSEAAFMKAATLAMQSLLSKKWTPIGKR
jgi:hypothetical protein